MKRELKWRAVYEDESTLEQYVEKNGVTVENKYPDIKRDWLKRFDLLEKETGKPVYSLWINEGQSLIYRRRTIMPVTPTPDNPVKVVYLVGYRHTVITPSGPRSFNVINYLFEDGSIALDDERSNLELYPIEQ